MIAANTNRNMNVTTNRLENFFVITPAVSIDRSHQVTRNRNSNFTTTALLTTSTGNTNTNVERRMSQWCSLWCSAIKCFNGNSDRATRGSTIGTREYQQNDNHFIRIDLPRKYRDKNCNVTYEL